MADRVESILALIPPAIAVMWVIVDATSGMVAADRAVAAPAPVLQVAGAASAADVGSTNRAPGTMCVTADTGARQNLQFILAGLPHPALQRLCQAGLKFTAGLSSS